MTLKSFGIFTILIILIAANSFCEDSDTDTTVKYSEDDSGTDDYPAQPPPPPAGDIPPEPQSTTSASSVVQDMNEIDEGKESEEIFPDGFDVVDGVIMDITNVLIQEVRGDKTFYKPYTSNRTGNNLPRSVTYTRAKEEAGWHFILFEDPDEYPGSGNMILLQKLVGFTMGSDRSQSSPRASGRAQQSATVRLYQAFHIKLGNEFEEEDPHDYQRSSEEHERDNTDKKTDTPTDTMPSEDVKNQAGSNPVNPYDNAELVSTDFENQDVVDKMAKDQDKDKNEENENSDRDQSDNSRMNATEPKLYQSSETVLGDDKKGSGESGKEGDEDVTAPVPISDALPSDTTPITEERTENQAEVTDVTDATQMDPTQPAFDATEFDATDAE